MSTAKPAFAFSQSLENANVRKAQTPANTRANTDAKGNLKALAFKVLQASRMRNPVRIVCENPASQCENSCENEAVFAQVNAKNTGLAWPMPEPSPIETVTPAGRYACLWAIASVYGAGLTKNASGGLTLTCPATMPPEAAQAAWDGLRMLETYMRGRLQ